MPKLRGEIVKRFLLLFGFVFIFQIDSGADAAQKSSNRSKISESQSALFYRMRGGSHVINPYAHLTTAQICTGTSSGFSSGRHDYLKWKAIYSKCEYVDGNVEINNLDPFNEIYEDGIVNYDDWYDFSFLDNIREITGYLIIHNTNLKSLRFKNLRLVRGKNLVDGMHSVFIANNARLELLDLTQLTEIQQGAVLIENNPRLCHMDEVNWQDLFSRQSSMSVRITGNANATTCSKCLPTCCNLTSTSPIDYEEKSKKCGCWYPNGCQALTRVNCHSKCNGASCFGPGVDDCCDQQCVGGCSGRTKKDCVACAKLRVKKTGECVDSCPRIQITDPTADDLAINPDGSYQFGITCVDFCPGSGNSEEFCMKKCPSKMYEEEEFVQNSATGEKGMRRFCKPCTAEKCQKSCKLIGELNRSNIKGLRDCEILNGNLIIDSGRFIHKKLNSSTAASTELTESDLEALSSLRIINGFVRIVSDQLTNLNFLRNLEVIRGQNLMGGKFSMVVFSKSLKTLGLNKLQNVENGLVQLQTEMVCLFDTVDWTSILRRENSFVVSTENLEFVTKNCSRDGYVCDAACHGCWSTGPKACQRCKTFKLDDTCVDECGPLHNGRLTYLSDSEERKCGFCHPLCVAGCRGPTEYDCVACIKYFMPVNETAGKCLEKCPVTHYVDNDQMRCRPCHKYCFGCSGPGDYIGVGGCNKCASGIVKNDADYSVIKCIERRSELNCSSDEFPTLVPEYLKQHPLRSKPVCRKCNDECLGCFQNGATLHTQCKSCRNFYSSSSNECVKNCSSLNEFLEQNSKNCSPCHAECKFGCSGPNSFECAQCRTYKLNYSDVGSLLSSLDEFTSQSDIDFNQADLEKYAFDFVYLSQQIELLYAQNSTSVETKFFCVSDCPQQLSYKTSDNFCTKDQQKIASVALPRDYMIGALVTGSVLVGALLGLIAMIGCWQYKLRLKRIERQNEEEIFATSFSDDNYEKNMSNLRLVNMDELELCKVLGRGAFGTVYEGYYKPFEKQKCQVRVAIKVLNKYKYADEKAVTKLSEELINEAKVMASVDHEYCLKLTALCLADPMMMVTKLMQFGSVVTFYQKYRDRVTEGMLLNWARQIAEGMSYLESRGIVHRDLAARNILVMNFNHIKITDFGLARILDSNEDGVYVLEYSLVPFKWLAIESLNNRLFTHKSDVWSYGVCLWEIFTFCSKPYAEFSESDPLSIINSIIKGTRLAKPQMASLDVYMILLRCWLKNPIARPDFKTLASEFSKMCLDPKRFLCIKNVDLDKPFTTIDENTHDLLQEFKNDLFSDEESEQLGEKLAVGVGGGVGVGGTTQSDKVSKDEETDDSEQGLTSGDTSITNNWFTNSSRRKMSSLSEGKTRKSSVITFKRPSASSRNSHDHEQRKISLLNQKTADEHLSKQLEKINKNDRFKKHFKSFLFNVGGGGVGSNRGSASGGGGNGSGGSKSKRFQVDGQTSSGTASTYLSYSYSSDSSQRITQSSETNSNFYEEQQGLLSQNQSYSSSMEPSPTTSNCDETNNLQSNTLVNSDSKSTSLVYEIKPVRRESTMRTNSDYLEPIMNNVMQNFEYFGSEKQQHPKRMEPIIIMPNYELKPKNNYYNEQMNLLFEKSSS